MLSCKILIIDDDEDDIGLLSEAFSQCGVNGVHYVFSAIKAFMYLEEVEKDCLPKLLVTDLYLPGMSGAEFIADLKNMVKYQHIHVVILSTNKNANELEKCQQMGALDYLVKPSTFEEYVQVASEIRRRAAV